MDQLNKKIRKERSGLATKKIHLDNAPAHKNFLTVAKLNGLKYALLENSPYSSFIVPYRQTHLQKHLKLLQDHWKKCIEVEGGYIQ